MRVTLLVIEALTALSCLVGGVGLIFNTWNYPTAWLKGSPFPDYVIPGLILMLLVGGSFAYAARLVWQRRHDAYYASGLAGLLMTVWIGTEVFVAGQFGLLEITFMAVGIVTILLSYTQRHELHLK